MKDTIRSRIHLYRGDENGRNMRMSAFARDRMKEEGEEPQMGPTHPERGTHSREHHLGE